MKMLTVIAAVLLAAPAYAHADPKPGAAGVAAPASVNGPSKAKKKETRYCVLTEHTGSRIERRKCLTRAQWLYSHRYDPLDDLKQ